MKQTEPVIHSDPAIMGGTPVLVGTDVPLETLARLPRGRPALVRVPGGLPDVTREYSVAALEQAKEALLARTRPA